MQQLKTWLVAVVIVLAPLPVGGYEAWLLPLVTLLAGTALLINLSRPSPTGDGVTWLLCWGVAAGWALLQGAAIFLWRDVTFYLPTATVGTEYGVLDVGRAVGFMVRLAVYGALAYTVAHMRREEASLVVVAIIVSASFQSLYGLVNHAAGNPSILGLWDPGMHRDSVMGTFYSRNQFAGYLAVALPIGMAWLWQRYGLAPPRSGRRALSLATAVAYGMLIAVALIGSGSRLGVTSAVIGLVLWGILALSRRQGQDAPATRLVLWGITALAVGAVLWFGPDFILTRFLQLSTSDARFAIWGAMLDMPFRAWLWGIGPGQFIDVFKLFQGPEIPQTYWRALNDPLQFALEYGLVGTAVTLLAASWGLRRVWPGAINGLRLAALAGVVAMLVHSLGDFDLRVIGTAVLFWAAVGIALRRR